MSNRETATAVLPFLSMDILGFIGKIKTIEVIQRFDKGDKMKKARDLMIIAFIYLVAYAVGLFACRTVSDTMLKFFVFDAVATVVTYVFSVLFKNSSVYDAYWSLTPLVMVLWLFDMKKVTGIYQILFLVAFCIWALRLTFNWCVVFTDFSYEDWRYKKYRDTTNRFTWPIVNFFGIHFMPTVIVFLGMLPIFVIAENELNALSLIGTAVLLIGVALEFFADRQMHAFLSENHGKIACRRGLWKYSRHPNYLGEITVWLGTYLAMVLSVPGYWYYGIGFLGVAILFNVVSIPLMEKRQIERRADYVEYQKETSRLLLRP